MKDLNLIEINKAYDKQLIDLSEKKQKELLRVILKDSQFLAKHNLIDYSLLLTLEHIKLKENEIFEE